MYVRDAKNRDEIWLLDHIEEMVLDDEAFRSREYVIAVDEETNERAGFGRLRLHNPGDPQVGELTSLGILPEWRGKGVGAHIVERLVQKANDEGFDAVYSLTSEPSYLEQFGFEHLEEDDIPERLQSRMESERKRLEGEVVVLALAVEGFEMPSRLRRAFKEAHPGDEEPEPEETPEDFGIDPDSATYKYDTGRR